MIDGAGVFFTLTLVKFLQNVPKSMWKRARAMRQAAPLLQLLLRDATAYLAVYVYILSITEFVAE